MGNIYIEQGNEFRILNTAIKNEDIFLEEYRLAALHVEEIVTSFHNQDYINTHAK